MNAPVLFRYVSFTFFGVCSLVTLALAASSISQTKHLGSTTSIARVDALLIVNALLGLLALAIVLPLERFRASAFTSRIWFEASWVTALCVLDLCTAAAVTAVGIHDVCSSTWHHVLPASACATIGGLQAFSWLASFTLLFHAVFLVVSARLNSARIPQIWQMSVVEAPWTSTTVTSKTGPVLPTYHEKQIPVYTIGVKPLVMVEKLAPEARSAAPKPSSQPAQEPAVNHKRTSDTITTPASFNATPPLYPQFFVASQARVPTQPSPAGRSASPHQSLDSGRSSPAGTLSSSASSRMSPPPSDVDSQTEAAPSSRASSPRTKRRPPPLNLAGLSAFDTSKSKSKRQVRS